MAFPPFGLAPLVFLALVPFIGWLHRLPPGPSGARQALAGGALLGGVHFGVVLHWIGPALFPVTLLAPFVYLAAVGTLSMLVAGVARAAHALRDRGGVPVFVGLPLAWTAGEWLRGAAGDLAFPWLGLGVALAPTPTLAGSAELVGAVGVGLWIALANGAVAAAVLRVRHGGIAPSQAPTPGPVLGPRGWAIAVAALLLPVAWGVGRDATLETREAGVAVAVRTELPRDLVSDVEARERLGMEALRRGADLLAADASREGAGGHGYAGVDGAASAPESISPAPDLVAWPETLLLNRVAGDRQLEGLLGALARRAGAPFLVGGYVPVPEDAPEAEATGNGLALFEPDVSEGGQRPSYVYAKRRLVPGVEAAPFVGGGMDGLVPGQGAVVGRRGDLEFGPLICYESAFPGVARSARAQGAEVLVNATNDAWFGGPGWARGRAGLLQHPPHLVLRALETRAGIVRSSQVGPAFFVDPRGRIHAGEALAPEAGATDPEGLQLFRAEVKTTDIQTWHTRTGEWAGWGSGALVLILLLLPRGPGWGGSRGAFEAGRNT